MIADAGPRGNAEIDKVSLVFVDRGYPQPVGRACTVKGNEMPARTQRQSLPPSSDADVTGLEPRELTRQEFGRRLQALMLGKGWNQAELARRASAGGTKLGRDSISTYINGHTFPTPLKLDALAKALGVSREQLLPNSMMQAMDAEQPAIELKQAPGHTDKAWLRINRAMSFDAAAQIIAIIKADDSKA